MSTDRRKTTTRISQARTKSPRLSSARPLVVLDGDEEYGEAWQEPSDPIDDDPLLRELEAEIALLPPELSFREFLFTPYDPDDDGEAIIDNEADILSELCAYNAAVPSVRPK